MSAERVVEIVTSRRYFITLTILNPVVALAHALTAEEPSRALIVVCMVMFVVMWLLIPHGHRGEKEDR